jgi:hypothetical protein
MQYILLPVVVGGGVGALIGSTKDHAKSGFWLGLFLGPIGWIITALTKR